jgi:hypothetical protein
LLPIQHELFSRLSVTGDRRDPRIKSCARAQVRRMLALLQTSSRRRSTEASGALVPALPEIARLFDLR